MTGFAPYGTSGGLAGDRGESYTTMKKLYDNMSDINLVAENMGAVKQAANNTLYTTTQLDAVAGNLGAITLIDLPGGIDQDDVANFGVLLTASDGSTYNEGSGHFTSRLINDQVEFVLDAGAPANCASGDIKVTLSYTT